LRIAKTLNRKTIYSKALDKHIKIWSIGYYTEKLGGIKRSIDNTIKIRRHIIQQVYEDFSLEKERFEALDDYASNILTVLELA